jgi:hypothetical protein
LFDLLGRQSPLHLIEAAKQLGCDVGALVDRQTERFV